MRVLHFSSTFHCNGQKNISACTLDYVTCYMLTLNNYYFIAGNKKKIDEKELEDEVIKSYMKQCLKSISNRKY